MTNNEIDAILVRIRPEYKNAKELTAGQVALRRMDRLSIRMLDEDPKLQKLVSLNANSSDENLLTWVNFFNDCYVCEVLGYKKNKATREWIHNNMNLIKAHIKLHAEGDSVDINDMIKKAVAYLRLQESLRKEFCDKNGIEE